MICRSNLQLKRINIVKP